MEQSLKRLEEQEQKYSAELDAALTEYTGLREQVQGFDPVQLYEARQAIRPGKEQEAENQAQQAYGEKYSPLLMFDSKKAVSRMLHEDMERQAVRRMVRQTQKEQQISNKGKRKNQQGVFRHAVHPRERDANQHAGEDTRRGETDYRRIRQAGFDHHRLFPESESPGVYGAAGPFKPAQLLHG